MAKPEVATRRAPSPVISRLRDQLQAAGKRASAVRTELKKSYSPWVKVGFATSTTAGGALAGVAKGFLGDGWLARGINLGAGLGLVVTGAMVEGAAGGAIAAGGAGVLAKVAGDATEDLIVGMAGDQ